ncbi:macrophage mannose receptor 1-like [Pieris brassicae]|uniref:macrophage mannose receptor 1-like n=1 Tax=Pieris brassicae TaxID=7116 RepID=UPI001E660EE0|nr:macrophage mannose receptor 1-like [Pieris brassicae]
MKGCIVLTFLLAVIASIDARRFRCDYKYFPEADGYLKLHRIPANWTEARLRCHLEGAKIASPLNDELKTAMVSMMDVTPKLKCGVFLGIHATFSRGDFFSVEGVPLSQIPHTWADGEPDNYKNAESCLRMTEDREFADVNCAEIYPYFCYKKTPVTNSLVMNECGTTDPEYVLDNRTGSCYKFHTIPRTWSRAYMACAAEGGYLAIINSDTESQVAKEIFAKHPDGNILGNTAKDVAFIGFHDWGEHGEWLTINSDTLQEAGFSKFSPGEPNHAITGEFCGSIYRNGKINDLWCENQYAFLCEKNPGSLMCEQDESPDKLIKVTKKSDISDSYLFGNFK